MVAHKLQLSDLEALSTESVNPAFRELDRMSIPQIAEAMCQADLEVPRAIERSLPQINAAIEAIVAKLKAGGRLFYVGAGTPGRLGVLDAAECPPTFSVPPTLVQGIIAGGELALTNAVEGAEDDADDGRQQMLLREVSANDAVVGITASGRTPFVTGALAYAREVGAASIGLSCNANAALSAVVEYPIEVVVGPELVAGSTRLRAGTAQKLVLNMLSTITMVQLGKTYGNLMVDVKTSNEKLVLRAVRLVGQVTGADEATAAAALDAAGGEVKTASVIINRQVDAETARKLLAAEDGFLRRVLEG